MEGIFLYKSFKKRNININLEMKFFKKVLFDLYPKIIIVQLVCNTLLLFIAVKSIPVNTEFHSYYNRWDILIIVVLSIIGTTLFLPKVLKIVFVEPNRGQRTTRIALLFFIFLSIASPNLIVLDRLAISHFGKTKVINHLEEVELYAEVSFFVLNQTKSLQEYENGYYINNHLSGKHKKTYHIEIYAAKFINTNKYPLIIGKRYDTDYPGRQSPTEAQRLIDRDLEKASENFEQINISIQDTLVRTFEKFQFKKFIDAAKLLDNNINNNTTVLELKTKSIAHVKRKSLIIYLGFSIFINLILIFFLATGKHFKE